MKSRPPVWVKCLVASNGLLEDRPGGQPSRYLRSAARRTPMVTDQVLAARYRSCSVRPPAWQASQRPAESPQSDDACSPAPPRCSHAYNGTRSTRKGKQMSNHFSADNLKFPGDDRRLDLTDVFAFTAPHDPDTTVRSEERREGKSVDLGGRRIIKKKNSKRKWRMQSEYKYQLNLTS